MKSITKFLTILAPISIVGVLTPTLVSCNKAAAYSLNYGDSINCMDSSKPNFHSIDEVRNAIRSKIDRVTRETDVKISTLNSDLASKEWLHILYYELIATNVFCSNKAVSLIDWKIDNNILSFKYNNGQGEHEIKADASSLCFAYTKGGTNQVYINVTTTQGTITSFRSYTYELCSVINE